jgi:hypothetical protein
LIEAKELPNPNGWYFEINLPKYINPLIGSYANSNILLFGEPTYWIRPVKYDTSASFKVSV